MTVRRPLALLAALALAACSRAETAAGTGAQSDPAAAKTASANGSIEPGAVAGAAGAPRDSISDRADRGRIAGDTAAKVWVVMASDFQCPFCKQWHDAFFPPLVRDYLTKNKIQMAFINMPLSMHPNAVPAAEAAMCASVQGKFWQIHDALFAAQEQWAAMPDASAKFAEIAGKIPGIDMNRWKSCVSQHQTLALIMADRDRARNAGVQSTPTFFVGDKMITGADQDLRAAIEAALKTKR